MAETGINNQKQPNKGPPKCVLLDAIFTQVGTFTGTPGQFMVLRKGIFFCLKRTYSSYHISLLAKHIYQCLTCFNEKGLSFLFIEVSNEQGACLRKSLDMSGSGKIKYRHGTEDGPYFNPESKDPAHQFITVVFDKVSSKHVLDFTRFMDIYKTGHIQAHGSLHRNISKMETDAALVKFGVKLPPALNEIWSNECDVRRFPTVSKKSMLTWIPFQRKSSSKSTVYTSSETTVKSTSKLIMHLNVLRNERGIKKVKMSTGTPLSSEKVVLTARKIKMGIFTDVTEQPITISRDGVKLTSQGSRPYCLCIGFAEINNCFAHLSQTGDSYLHLVVSQPCAEHIIESVQTNQGFAVVTDPSFRIINLVIPEFKQSDINKFEKLMVDLKPHRKNPQTFFMTITHDESCTLLDLDILRLKAYNDDIREFLLQNRYQDKLCQVGITVNEGETECGTSSQYMSVQESHLSTQRKLEQTPESPSTFGDTPCLKVECPEYSLNETANEIKTERIDTDSLNTTVDFIKLEYGTSSQSMSVQESHQNTQRKLEQTPESPATFGVLHNSSNLDTNYSLKKATGYSNSIVCNDVDSEYKLNEKVKDECQDDTDTETPENGHLSGNQQELDFGVIGTSRDTSGNSIGMDQDLDFGAVSKDINRNGTVKQKENEINVLINDLHRKAQNAELTLKPKELEFCSTVKDTHINNTVKQEPVDVDFTVKDIHVVDQTEQDFDAILKTTQGNPCNTQVSVKQEEFGISVKVTHRISTHSQMEPFFDSVPIDTHRNLDDTNLNVKQEEIDLNDTFKDTYRNYTEMQEELDVNGVAKDTHIVAGNAELDMMHELDSDDGTCTIKDLHRNHTEKRKVHDLDSVVEDVGRNVDAADSTIKQIRTQLSKKCMRRRSPPEKVILIAREIRLGTFYQILQHPITICENGVKFTIERLGRPHCVHIELAEINYCFAHFSQAGASYLHFVLSISFARQIRNLVQDVSDVEKLTDESFMIITFALDELKQNVIEKLMEDLKPYRKNPHSFFTTITLEESCTLIKLDGNRITAYAEDVRLFLLHNRSLKSRDTLDRVGTAVI